MANPANAFLGPAVSYVEIGSANAEAEQAQHQVAAAQRRQRAAEERADRAVDAAEDRTEEVALAAAAVAMKLRKTQSDLYETRRVLHGQLDVKDALKKALKEVAPDHPFVNPMESNPELLKIVKKSEAEFNGTV